MWLSASIGQAGELAMSVHQSFMLTQLRSAFQNTDLNYQLRQKEITKVVLAGLTTNHCVEATARYAYDLYVSLKPCCCFLWKDLANLPFSGFETTLL
jgi:hypothetical protein